MREFLTQRHYMSMSVINQNYFFNVGVTVNESWLLFRNGVRG